MTTTAMSPTADRSLRALLAAGGEQHRPGPASTSLTFAWRALLKLKHDPQQVFDALMFPIMFTLMFTYLFGGALAGSTSEYLQFFLPGVFVFTVVMLTMYTGIGLNTDVSQGVFNRFRSLPIWRPAVLVGSLVGDAVRYTLAATIVVGLGLALGFRPGGGVIGVVLALALVLVFAFSLSWVFTTLGLLVKSPAAVQGVSMPVLFPFVFASNLFVDPDTMPGWLQSVVNVNPFSLTVSAVRDLMDGTIPAGETGWVLLSCAALVSVFAPLTLHLYRNKQAAGAS
jgi:ABC-2 type transport system permease protein